MDGQDREMQNMDIDQRFSRSESVSSEGNLKEWKQDIPPVEVALSDSPAFGAPPHSAADKEPVNIITSPKSLPSPSQDVFPVLRKAVKSKLVPEKGTPPRSPSGINGQFVRTPKYSCASPIKRFYFPNGIPTSPTTKHNESKKIKDIFATHADGLTEGEEFREVTTQLGFSSYIFRPLFALCKPEPNSERVTMDSFEAFWNAQLRDIKHPAARLFRILLLHAKIHSEEPFNRDYLIEEDFKIVVQDVLQRHPGLEFLQESTNFHAKYVMTVIGRIFFHVNRRGNGQLSLSEIKKSNLMEVLGLLDRENDINEIFDYFSYEHFYVIYCKFWEMDSDHDFIIDEKSMQSYNDFALTKIVVSRILSGIPRTLYAEAKNTMSYRDFIPFIIAEEDKNAEVSVLYWFRVLDLDGDGVLSTFEIQQFFEEQKHRICEISTEPLHFEDFMCQLNDMIRPKVLGRFTVNDLINSKMAELFFNIIFNLQKFAQYEQRDPYLINEARRMPQMSAWDRFAVTEYIRYAEEDS